MKSSMLSQLDREVHVDGSVQYLRPWPKAELLQLLVPSSFCHGEPKVVAMVTATTATVVIMVTAKQPQLWSWLQQTDTIKNTPNTRKIIVHCSKFHACLNSRSCPENMCPNLCHGLAGSRVPP